MLVTDETIYYVMVFIWCDLMFRYACLERTFIRPWCDEMARAVPVPPRRETCSC